MTLRVNASRRRAMPIFPQTRFLEVPIRFVINFMKTGSKKGAVKNTVKISEIPKFSGISDIFIFENKKYNFF